MSFFWQLRAEDSTTPCPLCYLLLSLFPSFPSHLFSCSTLFKTPSNEADFLSRLLLHPSVKYVVLSLHHFLSFIIQALMNISGLVTICTALVPIMAYDSQSPNSGAESQIFIKKSTRHNEWARGRANEEQCSFYWGINLNGPLGS